ncbi:succinate-semialdehyde dehydrogenase/glutarate-semialdehyde dehydrogenase [Salsuginibacillus halophilus]|uniref:Aldehyde dehydrogenase n=1 Tax=Salsuginibacillus halophilus TaxID=517424 RepID=A0A2P8H952_9BACI|nr:NAD-dependent succinate-semialdehyde dehydrogenase [Salsuginibacillus halophilus]PSL42734.1 succinate-semialdehyde dehydrogenase/glutarate-semialdehyde dehydrogenase [Salsuginibacillus halophilus]
MEGKLFIQGKWQGGDTFDVTNPADGSKVGTAVDAGSKETAEAVKAASEAFTSWSQKTAEERGKYLKKLQALMLEHRDELGELITKEMGKPLQEAKGEVEYAASFLEWFAEEGRRAYGDIIPSNARSKRFMVFKQPVGVVGAITPWNFPQAMVTRKVAPALAAGCTVVLKPAEDTPLSAVKFAELCEQAGLPAGVFNLVTGDAKGIGDELLNQEKVRKVTFTGSTAVGKHLMQGSAEHVKKISLELGGHAPVIVLNDADLDLAVAETAASKFRNAGQTCVCANRVYVQADVYEAFVEKFKEKAASMNVGDGMDTSNQLGPLINKEAYDKVDRHVKDAREQGAIVETGGEGFSKDGGWFYKPTVLSNVTHDMVMMEEETFGPVAPIQKVETVEEAVELANASRYGLAAYFFTENMKTGMHVAENLAFGIVGWNDGRPSAAEAPFGGMKESGLDREGGREGLEAFLETKYVSLGVK